ncbi:MULTISPECIES: hypothetical protein [unclassified Streptomyces]|uniref:hypothetical protein n=1 Tax=unclassified Streptomyces TaxID=2593676 RepID=UPI002259EED0|nr:MULTISPECIES: hypothetical protein [unclassified Streptomyces]MCX4992699.1 hypothetical protein [Streptomyces sp. NBC_00568]MCX5002064.1 hypothetical protein [Streptomyces sp. NBC_00638]
MGDAAYKTKVGGQEECPPLVGVRAARFRPPGAVDARALAEELRTGDVAVAGSQPVEAGPAPMVIFQLVCQL